MDINSEFEAGRIDCNVPIISDEQQENVGGNPKTQLLSHNHFENMA